MVDYASLFYKPARMILAGAGGVDHDELVKLGNQHFGNVPPANMDHPVARQMKISPCRFTGWLMHEGNIKYTTGYISHPQRSLYHHRLTKHPNKDPVPI